MKKRLSILIAVLALMFASGCMASWNIETSMVEGKWRTTLTIVTEGNPEKAVNAVTDTVIGIVTPG